MQKDIFFVTTIVSDKARICSGCKPGSDALSLSLSLPPLLFFLIKECAVILSLHEQSWQSLSQNWAPCNLVWDAHEYTLKLLILQDSRATQKILTLCRQNRFSTTNENGDLGWGQMAWCTSASADLFCGCLFVQINWEVVCCTIT